MNCRQQFILHTEERLHRHNEVTQILTFNFNSQGTPHVKKLLEAAVESTKHVLIRGVLTASLTYKVLETVTVEKEGILKSRLLMPMPEDLNDLNALSLGYFLIEEPLTS